MPLLPPTRRRNRSLLADWLELTALLSPLGFASSADLRKLFKQDSDGDDHGTIIDPSTGEALDLEILDDGAEQVLANVCEELSYRASLCDACYPFTLTFPEGESGLGGSFRVTCHVKDIAEIGAHTFYVLCLLETGVRDNLVAPDAATITSHRLGLLFQIVSCLAMGGYLKGDVVWFGFPRPDHAAFLPALTAAFKRFGAYEVLDRVPPGYPADLKDAGIDIIGWIDFGDARGAKNIVFGQAASGYDWSRKTLLGYMAKLQNWFFPPPPAHPRPALLIPMPIYHEQSETDEFWQIQANGVMLYQAMDFGIIFDRFRVAKFAFHALSFGEIERGRIDGFSELHQITEWISELISELRAATI